MNFSVKADVKEVTRYLTNVQKKQVPFATALALTRTAQATRDRLTKEIPRVFENPTPFTRRSVASSRATKTSMTAAVFLKDKATRGTPAGKYLLPQIHGGQRRQKGAERALRSMGLIGAKDYAVPGPAAKLNQYGNMTKAQVKRMLTALRSGGRVTTSRGRQSKESYFFANIRGTRAVWVRKGKTIRPFVIIVDKTPRYSRRFDFFGIAQRTAAKRFRFEFGRAMQHALETAR